MPQFIKTIEGCRGNVLKVSLIGILFFLSFFSSAFAANSTPQVGTISPSRGSSLPNQAANFTTTYIDKDGWKNIKYAYFLINTTVGGAKCFYGYYNQNTNKLYLRNDANTGWSSGYAPGSSKTIQNSFVKLDCSKTTVSGSGTTLRVKWSITFKPAFLGNKNMYLKVIDDTNASSGWAKRGAWTIRQILSISINPNFWNIGATEVNKVITMAQANKIAVTNNGNGPETLTLGLVNPSGWTAATVVGNEKYVLSGLFCNISDIPQQGDFNEDTSAEDVIFPQPQKATTSIFGYRRSTANGTAIAANTTRALYLQFKSPAITSKKDEQDISVIISCQVP